MAREDLPKAVIQTHLVHQSSLFAHSLMLKRFRLSTCNLCRKILGLEVDPAPRRAACAAGDVGATSILHLRPFNSEQIIWRCYFESGNAMAKLSFIYWKALNDYQMSMYYRDKTDFSNLQGRATFLCLGVTQPNTKNIAQPYSHCVT